MSVRQTSFTVETRSKMETQDVTGEVNDFVRESGVEAGIAFVYSPHTTTGLFINENEPRLQRDILEILQKLVPLSANYGHDTIDDNASSHLTSVLVGNSVVVPLQQGRLTTGTWQSIFFLELDGPRRRTVNVVIVGE